MLFQCYLDLNNKEVISSNLPKANQPESKNFNDIQ